LASSMFTWTTLGSRLGQRSQKWLRACMSQRKRWDAAVQGLVQVGHHWRLQRTACSRWLRHSSARSGSASPAGSPGAGIEDQLRDRVSRISVSVQPVVASGGVGAGGEGCGGHGRVRKAQRDPGLVARPKLMRVSAASRADWRALAEPVVPAVGVYREPQLGDRAADRAGPDRGTAAMGQPPQACGCGRSMQALGKLLLKLSSSTSRGWLA
jgi:hypothetical protein